MFSYQQIRSLNQLEMTVYKFIISHPNDVERLTIRQMAEKSHVSATTILRFLKKVGYSGFSEFKFALKQQRQQEAVQPKLQDLALIKQFFDQLSDHHFNDQIAHAASMVAAAKTTIFFGLGTSGSLAQYGGRLFANYGIYTLMISDPFRTPPVVEHDFYDSLLILLSVSGETEEVLRQARFYKENGANILAITADAYSTLAQLADFNIAYNIPQTQDVQGHLSTQLPVVFLLEQIAQHAYQEVAEHLVL
ncbi:MurR/RpiR family transcriptional regulator [Loigolactobacillus coryniformis]|uniref:RpiR family transcriptional regulator n=1 Tax=Loigolactobacillus coryniformis subsp. torquens DSM 20004 = KCTC 3535 TaxID=1423822 RepID=A0A2D1KLH3_9LACO|nr:MurR/RpiR family transcriptional regulator [Loigolactobacillus coryniformis]ATO42987.1 RpiR family transcriptional regulator [Loigolactobacillus coryniformis subsp. torquens DSM 20004 = KCTC 3535]KRK84795.1 transcriptional regulator [Loigolactobacillus coryniformis subsp. torquens DSM 20004 = KCTC 3535]